MIIINKTNTCKQYKDMYKIKVYILIFSMKKFIGFLAIGIFGFGFSLGYSPTSQDQSELIQLKNTLDEINSGNVADMRNFMTQIKELLPLVSHEKKVYYLLSELYLHLYWQFSTEKIKTKQTYKSDWIEFLELHNTGIIELSTEDKCFGRYNTLDNISFANNFPTALTIATRYRESTCWYYLPHNSNGPFQIITKDYGTGEISEKVFVESVQDFIDFSKAKYDRYKNKVDINVAYTGIDLDSLISHSALYNGWYISGDIVLPYAPKYIYEWYSSYNSGEFDNPIKHWILPKFLKTLEYELEHYY